MEPTERDLLLVIQRIENLEEKLRTAVDVNVVTSLCDELQSTLMNLLNLESRLWEQASCSTKWPVYAKLAQAVGWRDAAEVAYDFAHDISKTNTLEAIEALRSGAAFALESAVALARLAQGMRQAEPLRPIAHAPDYQLFRPALDS